MVNQTVERSKGLLRETLSKLSGQFFNCNHYRKLETVIREGYLGFIDLENYF